MFLISAGGLSLTNQNRGSQRVGVYLQTDTHLGYESMVCFTTDKSDLETSLCHTLCHTLPIYTVHTSTSPHCRPIWPILGGI